LPYRCAPPWCARRARARGIEAEPPKGKHSAKRVAQPEGDGADSPTQACEAREAARPKTKKTPIFLYALELAYKNNKKSVSRWDFLSNRRQFIRACLNFYFAMKTNYL
jgi:hypothetical protein